MQFARRIGWALAMLLSVGWSSALAQTGTVTGRVTNIMGAAVSGAEVRVEGSQLHTTTNEQGQYELTNVPVGQRSIRVLMMGFQSQVQSVTVSAAAPVTLDFKLEESVFPLEPVEVVVGSRARHTAADELAVPVDVYNSEVLLRQGSTETSQALQSVSPSVNFPRQSVTDATDVVRPFTLRGLSPDHTLVLVNNMRRHQTALVNTFAYGMAAGSSGVDMNTLPSSAIDRIEVLRDGAAAQYGSDAIAGVVNVVTRKGRFAPFASFTGGQYFTPDYPHDGGTFNVSGGWGLPFLSGSLVLSAEYMDRQPTNRAWADAIDTSGSGVPDVVGPDGKVIQKNTPVDQPNYHWGDGLEKDVLTLATLHLPVFTQQLALYAMGSYSRREGNGNGYRRYEGDARNWPEIYPLGFLPEFRPLVTDYSVAGGVKTDVRGWFLDVGATYGHNGFRYELENTLNASLGPSPDTNQTSFFAGELRRDEATVEASMWKELFFGQKYLGLKSPITTTLGASYRRERWEAIPGEEASYIDGGHPDQYGGRAVAGSQVFPGFKPSDASVSTRDNAGAFVDLETKILPRLLVNGAARAEAYSDFGSVLTGKLAARWQPTQRLTFRGAASSGYRAPGLSQIHFSKVVTNVIGGVPKQVGIFPVDDPAARLLGSKDLNEEKSLNLSAGLALSPADNFTLTLDAYHIQIKDRILLGATFDDSTTLRILSNAGYTDISAVQYFTNGIDTKTQGVDLTADLRFAIGDQRSLDLRGGLNWGKNEITARDGLPAELATSTEETGIVDEMTEIAIEEERPDWRGTLSAEYKHARWRGLVRGSYFGKFASEQPALTPGYREEYTDRTLVDLELGCTVSRMELSIGARNVADIYPGRAKLDYNNNGGVFPWAAASPFGYNGRFLYTRLTWNM